MKVAYYIKKRTLKGDGRVTALLTRLEDGGMDTYEAGPDVCPLAPDTDVLLSFGGDGTFLSAAALAAPSRVPVLGVNMGRLGFLSAGAPDEVAGALLSRSFVVEEREMLDVCVDPVPGAVWQPLALNEMSVFRAGASMLGVDVTIDGAPLPTYWVDGLLVSTSSGSTAYNLSVGGPICFPDTPVLIIAPIAPHNLNVRPLIVSRKARVDIVLRSREKGVILTLDNRNYTIDPASRLSVSASPLPLGVIRPGKSNFVDALRSRLLWGEDVRNHGEQF